MSPSSNIALAPPIPELLTSRIVFFICFRECLECSIIVSVLLAFLKQTLGPEHDAAVRKRLVRQVWAGVGLGVLICLIICAGVIGTCQYLLMIGRHSLTSLQFTPQARMLSRQPRTSGKVSSRWLPVSSLPSWVLRCSVLASSKTSGGTRSERS